MDQESKEFLFKYLNNNSPTGFESSGQQIWLDYTKSYVDKQFTDTYGTAVSVINPESEYKVVIEAHADEISWFVNYINEEGYIYVIRNGGSDFEIAPSKRAKIHTDQGIIKAVFGWPAIHVRDNKEQRKTNEETIVLDCGCDSKKEVEDLGIHVGCVVTFDEDLIELNNRYLAGRALDNRIGGFMIAQVARKIKESGTELPFGLYVVNAVQEEVGLRGAQMIAQHIKPDVAIVTDVTHDTYSPHYNKMKQGDQKAGKGPVLTYAPAVHNKLLNMLIAVANKNNIPFQRSASSRFTGTDTDAFAYSNEGVASALISLPLKYMHTTVEMIHKEDLDHIINLMYHFLIQLPEGHRFKYFE
ncbi:MAG: M28 family peptidase [Cyclobacteriaceae bacterium]